MRGFEEQVAGQRGLRAVARVLGARSVGREVDDVPLEVVLAHRARIPVTASCICNGKRYLSGFRLPSFLNTN